MGLGMDFMGAAVLKGGPSGALMGGIPSFQEEV